MEKRHWIRLTRACNNRCIFCSDKDNLDGSCLTLSEIKKNLLEGKKNGCQRVVLSGGEPTLHPDIFDIVKISKSFGYIHVQLITNGRMLAKNDFVSGLIDSGIDEITFSLHGHTARLHDKQTQIKGSFNESLLGLLNVLRNRKIIVNIDIVINKINIKHLFEILTFFINLGIYEFDLLQVIPFGRAWENRRGVFFNIQKHITILRKAFRLSLKPELNIWINRLPAKYLEGFENLIQHPIKLFDELNGRRNIFEDFIKYNKPMPCLGQRCPYCILNDFCQDLFELKKKKKLVSKPVPYCLNKKKNNFKKKVFISSVGNTDLFKIMGFFIENRYFVKGLSCNICKFYDNCSGIPYGYVKKYGFKKPICRPRIMS